MHNYCYLTNFQLIMFYMLHMLKDLEFYTKDSANALYSVTKQLIQCIPFVMVKSKNSFVTNTTI